MDTAYEAIAQIDRGYEVDSLKMKSAAVSGAAKALLKPIEQKQLTAQILTLIGDAVAADRYDLAKPLGKIALSSARKAKDRTFTKQVVDRNKELAEIERRYEKVKEALAVLDGKPTDPEANLTVGKFRCFVQGKWDVGIPMLALGGDESVKALAAKELADKPKTLSLGDGWWALAEKQEGTVRRTIQAHAAEWYRKALPDLEGLAKAKVEKRLGEVSAVTGDRIPVDLLRLIDPDRDAVVGKWKFVGQALVTPQILPAPGRKHVAWLKIPYKEIPQEYSLRLVAERKEVGDSLVVDLAILDRQVWAVIDGFSATRCVSGLHRLDGKLCNKNESTNPGRVLAFGKKHVIEYTVRVLERPQVRVTVIVNGRTIINYKGNYNRLSTLPDEQISTSRTLAIGASRSIFHITEFELTPLSK